MSKRVVSMWSKKKEMCMYKGDLGITGGERMGKSLCTARAETVFEPNQVSVSEGGVFLFLDLFRGFLLEDLELPLLLDGMSISA